MDLYINSTTKDVAWMAGAEDIVFLAAILSLTSLTLCFCCIFYRIYSNDAVLVPAPLSTNLASMEVWQWQDLFPFHVAYFHWVLG